VIGVWSERFNREVYEQIGKFFQYNSNNNKPDYKFHHLFPLTSTPSQASRQAPSLLLLCFFVYRLVSQHAVQQQWWFYFSISSTFMSTCKIFDDYNVNVKHF